MVCGVSELRKDVQTRIGEFYGTRKQQRAFPFQSETNFVQLGLKLMKRIRWGQNFCSNTAPKPYLEASA